MPADLLIRALKQVWTALEPLNLPMAVMGGIAVAAWKHVRATQDIDVLIGIGTTDPDAILQSLAGAGLRPKRQPPVLPLGQLRIMQLLYEPEGAYLAVQVDLLLAESEYHREALTRRVPTRLPNLDVEVFVLACEDLILHKLLAGRVIDRADAAMLLRVNRASLDNGYLLRWVRELGLTAELAEIWVEAFPDEEPPMP